MRALKLTLICALVAVLCGCATSGYFSDRSRDAADIFSLSAGGGIGTYARISFIPLGGLFNSDVVGLRGGETFYVGFSGVSEFVSSVINEEKPNSDIFDVSVGGAWPPIPIPVFLIVENFFGPVPDHEPSFKKIDRLRLRHKTYRYEAAYFFGTFIGGSSAKWRYFTQIEVAAGFGPTLRFGFSIAELLDFVLGWTTIDILDDDIGIEEES